MLGHSTRSAARSALAAHRHAGAYEICLIAGGSVEWWVGRERVEVGPGEVFITRPDEEHGGVDAVIHPCDLYWVQAVLAAPWTPRALAAGFRRLRLRTFGGSPQVRGCFERLLAEHRRPDRLSPVAAQAAFHELLVTVLRDHEAQAGRQNEQTRAFSAEIRRATAWMEQGLGEDFAVAQAAQRVGLSVAQFHVRFRRETGFAPGLWRTRRRIALAKSLLRRPDASITQVAMDCGFSTSQYFATVFKKMVGLTPGEYRRRVFLPGRSLQ
jgi:AraC-like DNA-binding protein